MKLFCLLSVVYLGLTALGQAQAESLFSSPTEEEASPTPQASLLNSDDPFNIALKAPAPRGNMTITESVQFAAALEEQFQESHTFGNSKKSIQEELGSLENEQLLQQRNEGHAHLQKVLIGFILEAAITCLILQLIFSLSGFTGLSGHALLFSFTLASIGAALDYFLSIGLFNPFRIVLGFIILWLLILNLKDVRKGGTAIRIVLLARIISLGLIWILYTGLTAIFGF